MVPPATASLHAVHSLYIRYAKLTALVGFAKRQTGNLKVPDIEFVSSLEEEDHLQYSPIQYTFPVGCWPIHAEQDAFFAWYGVRGKSLDDKKLPGPTFAT